MPTATAAPATGAMLWCFGAGTAGQLGIGQLVDSSDPIPVSLPPLPPGRQPSTPPPWRPSSPHPRLADLGASQGEQRPAAAAGAGAGAGGRYDCNGGSAGAPGPGATTPPTSTACAAASTSTSCVFVSCGGNHAVAWWQRSRQNSPCGSTAAVAVAAGDGSDAGADIVAGPAADPHDTSLYGGGSGTSGHGVWVWAWGLDASGAGGADGADSQPEGLAQPQGQPTPAPARASAAPAAAESKEGGGNGGGGGGSGGGGEGGGGGAAQEGGGGTGDGLRVLPSPRRLVLPCGNLRQIRQVACGWEHTVFLTGCGALLVAGRGERGQLGLGAGVVAAPRPRPLPLPLPLSAHPSAHSPPWRVTSVAAGLWHTLLAVARTDAGEGDVDGAESGAVDPWVGVTAAVYGFGSNRRLQLGQGAEPRAGSGNGGAAAVGAEVGEAGRLGRRGGTGGVTGARRRVPLLYWSPIIVHQLAGPKVAASVQVYGGGDRSALIDSEGRLFVWGRGMAAGATAVTAPPDCSRPEEVRLPEPPLSVAALPSAPALSLTDEAGSAAAAPPPTPAPSAAEGGGVNDGTCDAGISTTRPGPPPASPPIDPAPAWRQVSLGWHHIVALDSRGEVWAWGSNRNGQLARPPPAQSSTPPPPPPSAPPPSCPSSAPSATATAEATAGVAASALPLRVALPGPCRTVAAGSEHCAAVLADGRVYTWGWGEHGQLGHGDLQTRWVPERVVLQPLPCTVVSRSAAAVGVAAGGGGDPAPATGSAMRSGDGRDPEARQGREEGREATEAGPAGMARVGRGGDGGGGEQRDVRCIAVTCGAGFTMCVQEAGEGPA